MREDLVMKMLFSNEEIKERKIYTLEESANILNLSRSTMLKLIKLGELPVAKIGKQYRILGIFLLRYILSKTKPKKIAEEVRDELSWQSRLDEVVSAIVERTSKYSSKEIEEDIRSALKEVREKYGR
ncbi:unnamed protein product [marine sediment metagenome]|uniref:Helix-turn-helix domain-containing protein n=2 Tax=marine sediment metagenome TaxID=412755 RepID=X1GQI2_9ZZZZ